MTEDEIESWPGDRRNYRYPIEEPVRVLSLGAGVQSSALLLMFDRGEVAGWQRPHFAVFADTGAEPTSVYVWLEKLKGAVSIPILTAMRKEGIIAAMNSSRFAAAPFFLKHPDGSQGIGRRQCTREFKIDVVVQAIRREIGYKPRQRMKHTINTYIGISTDEATRMKPSRYKWQRNIWPLIDAGMSRKDCVGFVESTGLGTPPRSACYMCPYRSDEEWLALKSTDSADFKKAVEFDASLRRPRESDKYRAQQFVHRSMKPLGEVDFGGADEKQINLFENECEGMCGV